MDVVVVVVSIRFSVPAARRLATDVKSRCGKTSYDCLVWENLGGCTCCLLVINTMPSLVWHGGGMHFTRCHLVDFYYEKYTTM